MRLERGRDCYGRIVASTIHAAACQALEVDFSQRSGEHAQEARIEQVCESEIAEHLVRGFMAPRSSDEDTGKRKCVFYIRKAFFKFLHGEYILIISLNVRIDAVIREQVSRV